MTGHLSSRLRGLARSGAILFFFVLLLPLLLFFSRLLLHPSAAASPLFSSGDEVRRLALLLATTLAIAASGATVACLFGSVLFAAIQHSPRRMQPRLVVLSALPLLIPGHFAALAWIQTVGNAGWLTHAAEGMGVPKNFLPGILYSVGGCAGAMALHFYPIGLAMLWVGWRAAGSAPLEAASLMMRPLRFWRHFLFGWLRIWLATGWLVIFLLCLLDYLVPFLLRRPVFTVEIMSAFSVHYDPQQAAALTLPLMAISLSVAALLGKLIARARWPAFTRSAAPLPHLDKNLQYVLLGLTGIILCVALVAPLFTFIKMAGAWSNYRTIFISARPQILTSLRWSLLAVVLAVILAGALTLISCPPIPRHRLSWSARIFTHALPASMLILFAMPGSVLGMAMITFWNRASAGNWAGWNCMGELYDSGIMLPLGWVTLFLPVAYFIFHAHYARIPRVLIEMEMLNPNAGGNLRSLLVLPWLSKPALSAALLLFVLVMQEGHASILLVAPGQETLSIRAYTLLHYAPDSLVAGLCLVSLGVMTVGSGLLLILAAAFKLLFRKSCSYCALD